MKNENFKEMVDVLLVDDDPGDIDFMLEVLDNTKQRINLNVVENGINALDYLRQHEKYANVERPDIILLDLNMPKKDGYQVLQEIKNDEKLKSIPVIVISTSEADDDILKTYTLGACCYIVKPVGLEQFVRVIESIENFWFTVVKYPLVN